eukprot:10860033-Lingulodinium_polyedra.AAC.1
MGGLDVGSLAARAAAGILAPRSSAGPLSPHRRAPCAATCATVCMDARITHMRAQCSGCSD